MSLDGLVRLLQEQRTMEDARRREAGRRIELPAVRLPARGRNHGRRETDRGRGRRGP